MKLNLHLHSTYSDGSDSMEDVFRKAKTKGLTHISVVDHDTVAHIPEGKEMAQQFGITFIPGIEISAYDFKRHRKVHILGYDFNENPTHIKRLCAPILERRHANSLWQLEQIQQAGWQITIERAMEYVKEGGILYKQHIMNALTTAPFESDEYQSLYRSLFKGSGVASRDIEYVDAFDAVRAIVEDGGHAVLAHPGQTDSFDMIEELVKCGLGGIEVYHPDHTAEQVDRIVKVSLRYDLFLTGGTDDHGMYGKDSENYEFNLQNIEKIPFIN